MKIRAVLFDLGKVLVDFNFETGSRHLHSACSISRNRLEEVLWDKNCIRQLRDEEKFPPAEFHANTCGRRPICRWIFPAFAAHGRRFFCRTCSFPRICCLAFKRKYPLILVSNTNQAHIEFMRQNYRLMEYFDHHVLSYEVGSLKPDRKIFEHAIAVAG